MDYSSGMQIYKYRLVQKIGSGEFGEVWTADDRALNSRLAIKLLDESQNSVDERLFEAQIGNRLNHPNVVNIQNADVVNVGARQVSIVIIAMPFFKNGSVTTKVNAGNFLDLDRALKCTIDILRGLEYLHENGYYHCDIKPQNILIGDKGEYVLSDYGLSCYSPTYSKVQPRRFYIPHAAPELLSDSQSDDRTDIYQLGLTAFRLMNGVSSVKDDFAKDGDVFKQKILNGKVVTDANFQPYVPRKLRRIILKAVRLNPNDRYQSALEMRRELETVDLRGSTVTANEHGRISVRKNGYAYWFETEFARDGNIAFIAKRENLSSGRVTRVFDFCCKVKSQGEVKKATQRFFSELMK
jgi:serine/threonine protein kinase